MDESISDFQEPKKGVRGPKKKQNEPKPSTSKPRAKKGKKIKGQKDIRNAMKTKNELVAYSKDFDQICRKSGIDVDSEQLQLAIALSKSLQNSEQACTEDEPHPVLTSQDRTGQIRTTLLEYGFKVPEIKITRNKKLKGINRNAKLLTMSEAEKQQIITDKYTQIMFESLSDLNNLPNEEETLNTMYNLTTNCTYNTLKDDSNFYVLNLIPVSENTVGSLLRDWSEIPGRPHSPILRRNVPVNIKELDINMSELDIILSGFVGVAQKIINNKLEDNTIAIEEEAITGSETIAVSTDVGITSQITRSESPDLFDDDIPSFDDSTKEMEPQENPSQSKTSSQPSEFANTSLVCDFTDLTECVKKSTVEAKRGMKLSENDFLDIPRGDIRNSQSSQSNKTEHISNNFIEATECGTNNIPIVAKDNIEVDLTQCSDENDDTIIIIEEHETTRPAVDSIDVTQSSDTNDSLPFVQLSKPRDENYTEVHIDEKQVGVEKHNSSTSNEENTSKQSKESLVLQEFVFEHSDTDSNEIEKPILQPDEIDLTQNSPDLTVNSRFPEVLDKESNNSGNKDDISIDYDEIIEVKQAETDVENSIIDKELNDCEKETIELSQDNSDDLALNSNNLTSTSDIEVFEISDEELNYSVHKSRFNDSQNSVDSIEIQKENFCVGGLSVLDDLSVIKSVNEIDLARISTIKKSASDSFLPEVEIIGTKVKIKSPIKATATVTTSPYKNIIKEHFSTAKTPNNSEYVIKTDSVTPILDYESMDTPQRNSELNKYGLKPFKRKRAIQLLTYLYNQTHPSLEECSSKEQPSPSKRRKLDYNSEEKQDELSEHKNLDIPVSLSLKNSNNNALEEALVSPQKSQQKNNKKVKTPQNTKEKCLNEKENIQYEVTSEIPVIRDLPCNEEDWVFQKREKAKIHSCRIPLHVAFHNYVSSRQTLREAILRYEPVNIDVIHKDLLSYGHRYDPKDLLRFLDKKCITVKTADNNSRNCKYQKKS